MRGQPIPCHSKEGKELDMTKRIRDVMTRNPRTLEANRPVTEATRLMRNEDVGIAPVVEGDRLVGTVTDRDIVLRVVAGGKDPQSTTVSEIAFSDLATVEQQQDLNEALRLMARRQVRRPPLVEEDGKLVGILAQADVARESGERKTGDLVEEISENRK